MLAATKRAFDDMRKGRNVGVYIAIVGAFGLALGGLLDLASDDVVRAGTLGILGALCAAILALRHQSGELREALTDLEHGRTLADRFLRRDCELGEISALVRKSREVWMWGSTLATHVPGLADDIRSEIRRGLRLKVMVIRPSSSAIRLAAFRSSESSRDEAVSWEEQRLNKAVTANLETLSHLAGRGSGDQIEYRVIDFLAPYVVYAFDPTDRHGRLMVRVGNFRGSHDDRPTFWLTRADDQAWFDHFIGQFTAVWEEADPWDPTTADDGTATPAR